MNMHDCCAPAAKKQNGHYDLAVLGAGSAGFSAAITAAELGANVALIGHGTIGGTCVNIGCRAVSFERKTAAVTYDDKRATLAALTAATTNAGCPSHQAR